MFKKIKLDHKRFSIIGLFAFGVSQVVRGAWMIYPPAAYLLLGCFCIALAVGFVSAPDK